jgi:hypothetical protein
MEKGESRGENGEKSASQPTPLRNAKKQLLSCHNAARVGTPIRRRQSPRLRPVFTALPQPYIISQCSKSFRNPRPNQAALLLLFHLFASLLFHCFHSLLLRPLCFRFRGLLSRCSFSFLTEITLLASVNGHSSVP